MCTPGLSTGRHGGILLLVPTYWGKSTSRGFYGVPDHLEIRSPYKADSQLLEEVPPDPFSILFLIRWMFLAAWLRFLFLAPRLLKLHWTWPVMLISKIILLGRSCRVSLSGPRDISGCLSGWVCAYPLVVLVLWYTLIFANPCRGTSWAPYSLASQIADGTPGFSTSLKGHLAILVGYCSVRNLIFLGYLIVRLGVWPGNFIPIVEHSFPVS